jgi:hypothetical protein
MLWYNSEHVKRLTTNGGFNDETQHKDVFGDRFFFRADFLGRFSGQEKTVAKNILVLRFIIETPIRC